MPLCVQRREGCDSERMKSKELFRLNIGLQGLAIFRNLLKDPVIAALREYLEDLETGETARSRVPGTPGLCRHSTPPEPPPSPGMWSGLWR